MGETCTLAARPIRIVSLVPSQTELLFDLGLYAEVVGITKFCTDPEDKVKNVKKVGGTKKFNFDVIAELKPDFIIGNKEENYEDGINQLKQDYPVWMSDIVTLDDALDMIRQIGVLVGAETKAKNMADTIHNDMSHLGKGLNKTAAYFIWQKPYMVAGSDTFIDEMMKCCGLQNIFANQDRYPETEIDILQQQKPDVVMLSTEPYPFKESHVEALQKILPDSKVILVDAMYFSWYGSRLLGTADYLRSLKNKLE
ncbi:ABC transporter substrate-binding protein [Cocleimonas flava]|uniref:ABC-type Fe3+-hydroxamate transport system substrate-binding protein n=1 Tax=Cocleimonas flava TaxID=634765 RepID=A0A4R1F4L1_9GAMM|nr:helical backbone metal receptor [Cocleimonas flava]TCJ87582.1 ABC-type Fe3+-hydroxamate transport system substrate-binding protein [Cocleimonas flava]